MFRISEYLSQSILIFISLSLISILYINAVLPAYNTFEEYMNLSYSKAYQTNYKVAYIMKAGDAIYVYNYGDLKLKVDKIYFEPVGFLKYTMYKYKNGRWIRTSEIEPSFLTKIVIYSNNINKISSLVFINKNFMIRVDIK